MTRQLIPLLASQNFSAGEYIRINLTRTRAEVAQSCKNIFARTPTTQLRAIVPLLVEKL